MYTQNTNTSKSSRSSSVTTYPNTEAISKMKQISSKELQVTETHEPINSDNPKTFEIGKDSTTKFEQDENLLILILTLLLSFDSECDSSLYLLIALTFILPNQ